MCYSAMIHQEYARYVRATGAQMDLQQFMDIFWNVAQGERIAIPRAVERWFDDPDTDAGRRIHELIAQRRARQAATWQQELFAQKKRLAEAERKLAVKETRAAAESRRIATSKIATLVEKLGVLDATRRHPADGRIFPLHYVPIVVEDEGRRLIRLARYHCRMAGKPASLDQQFPGLYSARRDNLEKYWRDAFGSSHALMLIDSFYENVERDGRNCVLHFQPRPQETMLVACLYSVWTDPQDGRPLLSFAAITDNPPLEVAATGHDRMVVSIRPENVDAWLNPRGRTDAQLQSILSDRPTPYYEHQVLAA
jgi:putative SOS response-associated peptidase YedK